MQGYEPITDAHKLSDLFRKIEIWDDPPPGARIHARSRGLCVGHYCTTRGIADVPALWCVATDAALAAIDSHMISIDGDRIYFEIIALDDRIRVFAKYGQIIGSRLLADLPLSEASKLPTEEA